MTNEEAIKMLLNADVMTVETSELGTKYRNKYLKANRMAIEALERDRWIMCNERIPEEHDSIFAKFYGTKKWDKYMWLKESDEVNITSELKDGTRITEHSCTHDGKWYFQSYVVERKVIAWRPLPDPYKESEGENE